MAEFGLWYQDEWLKNEVGSIYHYPTSAIAQTAIDHYFRDKDGIESRELDLDALFPGKRHRCPRRDEAPQARGNEELTPDYWQVTMGMVNGNEAEHCSYCGSMHPDAFLVMLQQGAEVIPTDKNYKAYIRENGKENKFYFQHFSLGNRAEFIALLNAGAKIGTPGHFYNPPYFFQFASRQ